VENLIAKAYDFAELKSGEYHVRLGKPLHLGLLWQGRSDVARTFQPE
jgi:hypothetical protein